MRILIHDYPGHPLGVQLSRSLARRGYTVRHVFSKSVIAPHGDIEKREGDPDSFEIVGIQLDEQISRDSFVKRRGQEIEHGKAAAAQIREFKPDLVMSANTPLDAVKIIQNQAKQSNAKFCFWVQDIIGIATKAILKKKLPVVGALIGDHYMRLEAKLLRASDYIVVIAEDFRDPLPGGHGHDKNVHVIENWAPIDEIPLLPRDNAWRQAQGFGDDPLLLYSGTLGFKHNPAMLEELAERVGKLPGTRLVLVSEGPATEWLRQRKAERGLDALTILPFQPFESFPQMLAAADVLVGVLEPAAGIYSVPSKVLSYLCSGRAIVLSVPPENLASRIVTRTKAGLAVPANDNAGFVEAAVSLLSDAALREEMGRNGRAYAEATFEIETITDRFEAVWA